MTTDASPRRRRGRGMSDEEQRERYPSLQSLTGPIGPAIERSWVAAFNARPDAMHRLIGDYIKQVHATPGRIGQRPMPREEAVDFDALVYGEDNDLPLIEVLPKLIKVSERAFVMRLHMSRSTFQRIMAGSYFPDVNELRMIAAAVGKPPVYFVEYRQAMATAAFVDLINRQPGIATSLYRTYLQARV